jgi:hypothetical protein
LVGSNPFADQASRHTKQRITPIPRPVPETLRSSRNRQFVGAKAELMNRGKMSG